MLYHRIIIMKCFVTCLFFLSISVISEKCYCQRYNLVPNYSFEDSVICPSATNGGPIPKPWYLPSNITEAFYLNSCSSVFGLGVPYNTANDTSFQYAKTGNGYAAFDPYIPVNNKRSYVQVKLKDSLQTGKCYHCTFWVSLSNSCSYATNNIALWFSKTKQYVDTFVSPYALLSANPQVFNYGNPVIKDTQNWVKISSVYVAQGGEQFITIGNFKNNANTNTIELNTKNWQTFYYVDDVSVIPLDSLPLKVDAGPDTTIATGDSVFIGSLTNGITNIKWYNSSRAVINTTAPGCMYARLQALFM